MTFEAKREIQEFSGFAVGDLVKLTGACMPRNIGKILRIIPDAKAKKEMAFDVEVKNEEEKNKKQSWFPIYLNELSHA
jgi:hypothetical protein